MNTIITPTQGFTMTGNYSNGHSRNLRPMSSRLSQRVQAVPPSGIRKYFDIAATMDDVVSLGIGEPDFVSPPPILQAGITSLQRGHTSYTSNSGIYELREAVADNLRFRYGARSYDIETEVLITVGVSEAMYLAMQAILDPGDEVIVPQPCFVSFTASVILAGGTVVDVPTYAKDNFFVSPQAIEAAITTIAPEARFPGRDAPRLPNTTSILLPGVPAETQVIALDLAGIRVSAGAACSSGKVGASHVLAAMGLGAEAACAIRVSLPWNAPDDTAGRFVAAWTTMRDRVARRAA